MQYELPISCEPPPPTEPAAAGRKCRHCIHLVRHSWNGNLKYCELQRQRGTAYGLKKIKSGDPACHRFELITSPDDGAQTQ